MGRYLVLWEIDPARVPINPQERGAVWLAMADMIKQDMKKGVTKDWGVFLGELSGYSIEEGTELEVMSALLQYVPYVNYAVHPIASLSESEEAIKASMK